MAIDCEIFELKPDMDEEFVRFFDETEHDDGIDENKCYCVNWIKGDGDGIATHTAAMRREAALKFVEEGKLRGYFARVDGKNVGWINANDKSECICCPGWRWFMDGIPHDADKKTMSIFCLVIAPGFRRQGLATRLVERAISDAAAAGYDFIEAYPNQNFMSEAQDFRGPQAMYAKLGFEKLMDVNGMTVMRKKLK